MAVDLIKSYLIGIGFNVDANSAKEAENSIGQAEEKIEKFNKNSKKGFSESGEAMKSLFGLFGSSNVIGKLFPGLQGPVNALIKDIKLAKKLYTGLSKTEFRKKENKSVTKKVSTEAMPRKILRYESKNNSFKPYKQYSKANEPKEKEKGDNGTKSGLKSLIESLAKAKEKLKDFKINSTKSLTGVEKSTEALSVNGGKALSGFSLKGVAYIGVFAAAVVAAVALTKKLVSFLNGLAKQDIEYEKLSRQLGTTKDNAKDIDGALKTLGVTMQDLWLSPTLLKQFNQLRKDSSQLRLPPEFKDNIKVIQGIGLEFKRLKQLGTMALQWIGHYILKYIAGPLAEFKKKFSGFNDKLIKVIPTIAKVIGSAIGIILRLLLLVFKVLGPIFSIISKIVNFVLGLIDKIPEPLKKILKIIVIIGALILAGPVGALILVLGLLDDLFTFLRGGKSIIGSVFGFFKSIGRSAIEGISSKFGDLKSRFKDGMASIKDDWSSYWDKASNTLDKLKDKAKEVWGDIKEWSKGLWEKTKDYVANIESKIQVYNKDIGSSKNTSPNYAYSKSSVSNSETTTNSNNKVDNNNTIHVYGSDDPRATASAISKKLTGITTRSVQGVY